MQRLILAVVVWVAALAPAWATPVSEPLTLVVPDRTNRQHFLFWVARGAKLFEQNGVDLRLTIARNPRAAPDLLIGGADCAILPPPLYYKLFQEGAAVKLVANLLANEPANVVLKTSVARQSGLGVTAPLAERVKVLAGKRIGVAAMPRPRLFETLFHGGVKPVEVTIQVVAGEQQNEALKSGKVDAIFAHTPFLEQALAAGDGLLWVNTSAGQIPRLTHLVIHGLVCTKSALENRRPAIQKTVAALTAARELIQLDRPRAVKALATALGLPPLTELEILVEVYTPALPAELSPSVEDLAASIALFPQLGKTLSTYRPKLAEFIASDLAQPATKTVPTPWWVTTFLVVAALAGLAVLTGIGLLVARARRT